MKQIKTIVAATLLAAFLAGPVIAQDKMDAKKTTLKKHVCTANCKDGKHVYAHGEKGHKCTDACKKMMMEKKS